MDNLCTSVRWLILAMVSAFGIVSYVVRMNISISADLMMPALSLSTAEMGQIFGAFLIGYAVFQVPGGILGDSIGPRHADFGWIVMVYHHGTYWCRSGCCDPGMYRRRPLPVGHTFYFRRG
jgi:sugar phosphate permease